MAILGKRRRGVVLEEYAAGSVVKVEVKNFMTYAHCVIEPGPKLNLVLGPNGTGKSSLVCALCVGLAGSTKLLGRAEDVSSFVRRGTQKGEVAVTLSRGNGSVVVVKRQIKASENASQWWIDGKSVKMNQVKELVKKYNIQLDNLCQFLPQDKVNEFARMKPIELLKATEAAIGDGELARVHEELIEGKKELMEKEKHVRVTTELLDRLKAESDDLDRLVAPIKEKRKLEEDIRILEQKTAWSEYEECKKEGEKDEEMLKKSTKSLDRMIKESEESNEPVKQRTAERTKLQKKLASVKKKVDDSTVEKEKEQIVKTVEKGSAVHDEISTLVERSRDQKQKVERLKQEVERMEYSISEGSGGKLKALQQQQTALQHQQKDIAHQNVAYSSQMETLTDEERQLLKEKQFIDSQIHNLNDRKMQRLRALEIKHNGITQQYEYVEQNRKRFKGHVYGPVALEVQPVNGKYASMLETQLPVAWLSYFVVEYEDDMTLLRNELRERGLKSNIALFSGDSRAPLKRIAGPSSAYGDYGIVQALDESFTAPMPVKHALDENFFLSAVFVANSDDIDYDAVFKNCPKCEYILTPSHQIRRKKSRYDDSSAVITMSAVRPATVLGSGNINKDDGQRQVLEQKIAGLESRLAQVGAKKNALAPRIAEIKARHTQCSQELTETSKEIKRIQASTRQVTVKLQATKKRLHETLNQPDPIQQKETLEKKVKSFVNDAVKKALKIPKGFAADSDSVKRGTVLELSMKELSDQIQLLSEVEKKKRKEMETMRNLVNQLEDKVRVHAAKTKGMQERAKELTGWPIPDDTVAKFDVLPASSDSLKDLIEEKRVRLDNIVVTDPSAQRRYESIQMRIQEGQSQLERHQAGLDIFTAKVDELKQSWLAPMRTLVGKINSNFSEAFRKVGIAGEVVFNEVEGEDFAKYSIDLKVKFREGANLMTLDAAYHSGGESSTSTILYLMALQGVTTSPFRVVDEINQGMDSINERSVFKMLVDAATAPQTPQCFLLTPKLLPDLPFGEAVTVLQIMNGVHIKEVATGFVEERIIGRERNVALRTSQMVSATS